MGSDDSGLPGHPTTVGHSGHRPNRRCGGCGRITYGHACKRRTCPSYAPTWARDHYVRLRAALDAYGAAVMMGMATAPGVDVLPWDAPHCAHLGPHRHSGMKGCRVREESAEEWNLTAPTRWRRLHQRCMRDARRRYGDDLVYLGAAWEPQKRGVLHRHPFFGARSLANRAAATYYMRRLADLSEHYGFGRESGLRAVTKDGRGPVVLPPERAAAYIAGYLVDKSGKGKRRVQAWVTDRTARLPSQLFYVSPALTRRSGITMRSLRARRYLWALLNRAGCTEVGGWIVDADGVPALHLSRVYPGLFPPP